MRYKIERSEPIAPFSFAKPDSRYKHFYKHGLLYLGQDAEIGLGWSGNLKVKMRTYAAECDLPDMSPEQLAATQQAAIEMSRRFTVEGKPVRYIRSLIIPSESHCICLFEAANAKIVQEVNEAAQIPFTRIIEAMELTSDEAL